MPVGAYSTLPYVARVALINKAATVLDLGVGNGVNGAIIFNYMRYEGVKIHGVEAFASYLNPMWDCYNHVTITEIELFLQDCGQYDVVIMTDVIEHFDKLAAIAILSRLKEICNKAVMVSTPGLWIEQGEYRGNKYETHRSKWTADDFRALGYGIISEGNRVDQYGTQMIIAEYVKP